MTHTDNNNIGQAMVFAAGLGTRLKPLTDTMPKALVSVGGKPLIEHVLKKLSEAGFNHIVVNTHHFANQIIDYLNRNENFGLDICISDETQELLDTGGGLRKAQRLFSEDSPILIHNVDIISNADLKKLYDSHTHDATLLVSNRKTKRYLLFNDDMRLVGWTNIETGEVKSPYPNIKPTNCHLFAFSGIHVFSPHLFKFMDQYPNKFGIIDFYLKVCAQADIRGYAMDNLHLMDVGKITTISEAENFIRTESSD